MIFRKIVFLPLLEDTLNFYVKLKNLFMLETERDRAISKFLTFGGLLEFLHYLNFCVKDKNTFILETKQEREILMKFLTHRVSARLLLAILIFC